MGISHYARTAHSITYAAGQKQRLALRLSRSVVDFYFFFFFRYRETTFLASIMKSRPCAEAVSYFAIQGWRASQPHRVERTALQQK